MMCPEASGKALQGLLTRSIAAYAEAGAQASLKILATLHPHAVMSLEGNRFLAWSASANCRELFVHRMELLLSVHWPGIRRVQQSPSLTSGPAVARGLRSIA